MQAVIEKHTHKDFIEAAMADGWAAENGPWGYSEGNDLSVTLTKQFPNLGGTILVWMINRNTGTMEWSREAGRWVHNYPENLWSVGTQAWLKMDRGGDRGLSPNGVEEVMERGLSESYWDELARTCDNCGKVVEHVNHVAFANKACDECSPVMRRKMERPGWAD